MKIKAKHSGLTYALDKMWKSTGFRRTETWMRFVPVDGSIPFEMEEKQFLNMVEKNVFVVLKP